MNVSLGRLIRDLRELKELTSEMQVNVDAGERICKKKMLREDYNGKYKIERLTDADGTRTSYRIVDTSSGEWRDMESGERERCAQKAEQLFQRMSVVFPHIESNDPSALARFIKRTMARASELSASDPEKLPLVNFGKLPEEVSCVVTKFSMTTDSDGQTSSRGSVQSKDEEGLLKVRPMSGEELSGHVKLILACHW